MLALWMSNISEFKLYSLKPTYNQLIKLESTVFWIVFISLTKWEERKPNINSWTLSYSCWIHDFCLRSLLFISLLYRAGMSLKRCCLDGKFFKNLQVPSRINGVIRDPLCHGAKTTTYHHMSWVYNLSTCNNVKRAFPLFPNVSRSMIH